jgi:hypothetical protein
MVNVREACAFAAKRLEASGATTPAQLASIIPTVGCPLTFLSSRLYLVSFLSSATSQLMVRHFLRHYLHTVGVPPRHVHVVVQRSRTPVSYAFAEFMRASVPLTQIRMDADSYKEARRMHRVNEIVNSLPNASYVIHADIDELFVYPCWLQEQLARRGDEIFCAEMQDRLSQSGRITPLADTPSIHAQYPKTCYLRQHILKTAAVSKIVLMKVSQKSGARRWFLDSHHVTGYRLSGMRCRALGYFDHFTLTAEQLALTRRKLAKGSPFKAVQRKRVLYEQVQEFMDKFAAPHGDATQHKWCRGPPRRAVQNVTILQQTHLDYCGLRRLVGDRKAK